jgi:hypothetical protein
MFQDGKPMTAQDVAATFNLHADPDNGSNALSAFTGVLSKGGAQVVDDATVMFELDAPNGNFPYSTSSDNYNLIILPKGFDPTKWVKTFPGTGPWKMEKYTPNVGVTYTKNPDYWDKTRQPKPDRHEIKYYEKEEAAVLGIQGGEVEDGNGGIAEHRAVEPGARGDDHQGPQPMDLGGNAGQHRSRRVVNPVQVLHDQRHRVFPDQRVQHPLHGRHRALARLGGQHARSDPRGVQTEKRRQMLERLLVGTEEARQELLRELATLRERCRRRDARDATQQHADRM